MKSTNGTSDRVRATRDGDLFHHMWAANRLLKLLDPTSDLMQISIEGLDLPEGLELEGEEVVDLAEYYGTSDKKINKIKICQFKHSTFHADKNLSLSEIRKIIQKFANLDDDFGKKYPEAKISFSIITNKPISSNIIEAVKYIASGKSISDNVLAGKLLKNMKIELNTAISLCSRIELVGNELSIALLRQKSNQEISTLTADTDNRSFAALLEIVASRAGTENHGPILRGHVITALGCREDALVPAPCQLEETPFIQRQEYNNLANEIIKRSGLIIITAEGGIGKSTFARALPTLLKDSAEVIIYDCFGKGSYRKPNCSRHRHRDGLIQIATEIASLNLGMPIVPTKGIAPEEYIKLFVQRLATAGEILAEKGSRHLVILIDAADNAVVAAEEIADIRPFVYDLLTLSDEIPNNVHIVLTCRPERLCTLKADKDIPKLKLSGYSLEETAQIVRNTYELTSDRDAAEIHTKTGGNPRVVAAMLDKTSDFQEVLDRLSGITDEAAPLDALMQKKLDNAMDNAGEELRQKLETVTKLIIILRPGIPVDIIAKLAKIEISAIKSFISDMGRGLVLNSDHLQFLDEATETYFYGRQYDVPYLSDEIIAELKNLGASSSYAAAALPEVLWNVKRYDDLLELAESDEALPNTNDIEYKQVRKLRVEFGLRAAVLLGRPNAIVRLAMQAGKGRDVESNQLELIKDNPDIAGTSMSIRVINDLIATRKLPSTWPGSTLGAEAAMLAYNGVDLSVARSRVRQAKWALTAWRKKREDDKSVNEAITLRQIVNIALASLKTDGPEETLEFLSQWQSESEELELGADFARTLISLGDEETLLTLIYRISRPMLLLGFLSEMQRSAILIDNKFISEMWNSLDQINQCLYHLQSWSVIDIAFRGVSWISALAVRNSIVAVDTVVKKLQVFLPSPLPTGLGDRHMANHPGILFAIALMIELQDMVLNIENYRAIEIKEDQNQGSAERELAIEEEERLERNLKPCFIWLTAWAKFSLGRIDDNFVLDLLEEYPEKPTDDDIQSPRLRLARSIIPLVVQSSKTDSVEARFTEKVSEIADSHPIEGVRDILPIIPINACFSPKLAIKLANSAHQFLDDMDSYDSAQAQTSIFVEIARGFYRFSGREAKAYFNLAVKAKIDVGDDSYYRWETIVSLTQMSAGADINGTNFLARRVARLGEIISDMYDGVHEYQLTSALISLAGPEILQILGEWRDRRFGSLNVECHAIVEESDDLFVNCSELKFLFSPFSSLVDMNRILGECKKERWVAESAVAILNDFASRLGRTFDADRVLSPGYDFYRPEKSASTSTTRYYNRMQEREKLRLEKVLCDIQLLDLAKLEELNEALSLANNAHMQDSVIVDQIFSRDEIDWSSILDALSSSCCISHRQFVKVLNEAFIRKESSSSLSFVDSLRGLVDVYLKRYSTNLFLGNLERLNLSNAAEIMNKSVEEFLLVALKYLNIDEVLTSAWHCYQFARVMSRTLAPNEALEVLEDAVKLFEEDLKLQSLQAERRSTKVSVELAMANFLWSALGDPRAVVRWQAAHAVRLAIELEMAGVVLELCNVVMGVDASGYFDNRFPFYEMNAAEWILIAIERSALEKNHMLESLLPIVLFLSDNYPDHATIQLHCYRILKNGGIVNISAGTNWYDELLEPVFLENFRSNDARPYLKGAPRSDFRFDWDFEQHVLGGLTRAFDIEHKEVLDLTSHLILSEWGWRQDEDPRHSANVFRDHETYVYKYEVPKAEDLRYYLQRHAALTIAGRLMRSFAPYCESHEEFPYILKWVSDFDIKRPDGRWIADQRNLIPSSIENDIDFLEGGSLDPSVISTVIIDDGFIIVWQNASVSNYNYHQSIDISSALVNRRRAHALVRTLQSSEGCWTFRLPSVEDDEFQFDVSGFQLLGWISVPYSEGGIDELDQFAYGLTTFLPKPSQEIADLLDIVPVTGGTFWVKENGEGVVMKAETWSDTTTDHDFTGTSGYRLGVDKEALDEMLTRLDLALVVELKVTKSRDGYLHSRKTEGEEPDNGTEEDFRIFTYQPGTGWRDYLGDIKFG